MQIHPSARRHGVRDEDIKHAHRRAVAWVERGEDPPRYLVVGRDRSGNVLEVVVIRVDAGVLAIHAMPLRPSTQRELFGEQD